MEIIDFLSIDSSRLNADIVVEKIEEDPDKLTEVWNLAVEDSYPLSMRASRVIWLLALKHPYFIEPYVPEIIERLKEISSAGVKRNFMNILSVIPISAEYAGILFDMCLKWIENSTEPIGVRANAMSILYSISNTEPELKLELISILETMVPDESMGIETRARLLLRRLYKEIR